MSFKFKNPELNILGKIAHIFFCYKMSTLWSKEIIDIILEQAKMARRDRKLTKLVPEKVY